MYVDIYNPSKQSTTKLIGLKVAQSTKILQTIDMNPIAIPDRAHRDDQELERGPKSTGIRKQQMRTEYSGNGQERKSYRDSKKFTTTSHDVTHRLDSPQFAHAPGLHARTCNANQRRHEPLGAAGWDHTKQHLCTTAPACWS